MIRLCSVIADAGENSIFQDLAKQGYSDSMKKMTAKTKAEVERKGFVLKPKQERLVEGFLESLGRLRVGRTVVMEGEEKEDLQMRILEGLEGAARTARVSPAQGWFFFCLVLVIIFPCPILSFFSFLFLTWIETGL